MLFHIKRQKSGVLYFKSITYKKEIKRNVNSAQEKLT